MKMLSSFLVLCVVAVCSAYDQYNSPSGYNKPSAANLIGSIVRQSLHNHRQRKYGQHYNPYQHQQNSYAYKHQPKVYSPPSYKQHPKVYSPPSYKQHPKVYSPPSYKQHPKVYSPPSNKQHPKVYSPLPVQVAHYNPPGHGYGKPHKTLHRAAGYKVPHQQKKYPHISHLDFILAAKKRLRASKYPTYNKNPIHGTTYYQPKPVNPYHANANTDGGYQAPTHSRYAPPTRQVSYPNQDYQRHDDLLKKKYAPINPVYIEPTYNKPVNKPTYPVHQNQQVYQPHNQQGYRSTDKMRYLPHDQPRYQPHDQPKYQPHDQPRYQPNDQEGYRPHDQSSYPNSDLHEQPGYLTNYPALDAVGGGDYRPNRYLPLDKTGNNQYDRI